MVQTHQQSLEEGTKTSLHPQEAEKIWNMPQILKNISSCTIESILTSWITAWYDLLGIRP